MFRVRSRGFSFRCSLVLLAVAGCGGGGDPGSIGSVSGTVYALTQDGLRLQLDSGSAHEEIAVEPNASGFHFGQKVLEGQHYNVTVKQQPQGMRCTVASGEGSMGSSPASSITVYCGTSWHQVGGAVTGLGSDESVVLQLNGTTTTVTGSGSSPTVYRFDEVIPVGASYSAGVQTSPAGKACAITDPATASGVMADADVTYVNVTCSAMDTVTGTVVGLAGSGLVLQLNGANDLHVAPPATRFAFSTPLVAGATYRVSVLTNPTGPSQYCAVTNAERGTMVSGGVSDVVVTCSTESFPVSGSVQGLLGTGLVLTLNGGFDLPIAAQAASFSFPVKVQEGAEYTVKAIGKPLSPSQTCQLTDEHGTMTAAGASVGISCSTDSFHVGGTSFLPSGLTLALNGVQLPVNGNFTFPNTIPSGTSYTVTAVKYPSGYDCGASIASGTMGNGDVRMCIYCCPTTGCCSGGACTTNPCTSWAY